MYFTTVKHCIPSQRDFKVFWRGQNNGDPYDINFPCRYHWLTAMYGI